jgi:hypothetical protein
MSLRVLIFRRFLKAPRDPNAETQEKKQKVKSQDSEEAAFGTYASSGGEKFVYREKKAGTYGGYKIVTKKLNGSTSREGLLDMRAKKKSDRFCN